MEATVQQSFPLTTPYYYLCIFCLTVVYYTKAYITDSSGYPSGERNIWYAEYKNFVGWSQVALGAVALSFLVLFATKYFHEIKNISAMQIFLLIIFPLVAGLYYGVGPSLNIRRFGWMKPFIIGFSWAGVVTVYPIIFDTLVSGIEFRPTIIGSLLFLKNFMFISVLCIMFDIKDYVSDSNQHLETFIVRLGLRKTIFYVILPLCVLGLGTFIAYGFIRHFHFMKLTFNLVPFVLLIWVAYSLHHRRSLLYYLAIVDGLMLVKGICGTIGMLCFS
jgi:hypothetical protein